MEKIEVSSEEELQALKTKAMKCKVILLDQWEKHPLTNPSTFNKRQKDRFLKELTTMMMYMTEDEIDKEFNSVVSDRILACGEDISKFPVAHVEAPDYSVLYPVDEEVVNIELTDGSESKAE
jgi:hypothetical protein